MEELLTMSTAKPSVRSEAVGWGHEDPALLQPGPIGRTLPPRPSATPPTVLHALADGWRLLAPPRDVSFINPDGDYIEEWEWFLVRESRGAT